MKCGSNYVKLLLLLLLLLLSLSLLLLKYSSDKRTYLNRKVVKVSSLVHPAMVPLNKNKSYIGQLKSLKISRSILRCSLTEMCYLPLKILRVNWDI